MYSQWIWCPHINLKHYLSNCLEEEEFLLLLILSHAARDANALRLLSVAPEYQ